MEILFWKHKCSNPQFAKIYLRITVDGKRAELGSTNIEINIDDWDATNKEVKRNDPHYTFKNEQLLSMKTDLMAIYNDFLRKKKPFTVQQIKFCYENQDEPTFIQGFDKWLLEVQNDPKRTHGTYVTYKNVREKVLGYLIKKNKHLMYFQDFELSDLLNYRMYLESEAGFADSTIRKHTKTIMQVTRWGRLHKLVPEDNLFGYRVPMEKEKPLINLNQEQFEKLVNHKFKNKSVQEVADVFIVYCRTGFHYQDLKNIKEEYQKAIVKGIDGKEWIYWERIKTQIFAKVPFFKEVDDIITKYGGWENLPIKSNQKMNAWLKVMAAELDFPEKLSVKSGRKTLSDWLLNERGWQKESVRVLLGLKTDKSLDAYAKTDERRVVKELENM